MWTETTEDCPLRKDKGAGLVLSLIRTVEDGIMAYRASKTAKLQEGSPAKYIGAFDQAQINVFTTTGLDAGDWLYNTSTKEPNFYNGAAFEPAGTRGAISVIGDTGGVAATDIVAISGYDSTTGFPKVKPADATISAALYEDLYFAPVAIAATAVGTVVKRWTGALTTDLASATDGADLYLSSTAGDVAVSAYDTTTEINISVGQAIDKANDIAHIDLSAGEELRSHDHGNASEGGSALTPVTMAATGAVSGTTITGTGLVTGVGVVSASPTVGSGYVTGAGGTVTQVTNRSTGVTINKICGEIITDTTSLAAEASAEFVVTNSTVAATDTVVVCEASGADGGGTIVHVTGVAAGSFNISVHNGNVAAGTAETGAIKINFAVIKAVAA